MLLSLAACTQEELPGNQDKAQQLTFSVTDGGYTSAVRKTTRTVENGCQTKFSEGGACGLYVVRGTQTVRKLDDYIVQDIKDRGDLIYVGLLLSNTKTSETVEKHLNSDNSNLVFISIGIGQPEEFIKSIFEKAEELISNPDLL